MEKIKITVEVDAEVDENRFYRGIGVIEAINDNIFVIQKASMDIVHVETGEKIADNIDVSEGVIERLKKA